MENIEEILARPVFSRDDLLFLLNAKDQDRLKLFEKAKETKLNYVGRKVYFRGLIEYSNFCNKNCFYCGIRAGNSRYARYQMSDVEVLEAVKYAYENDYASIVIQSGERTNKAFVSKVESLLKRIGTVSQDKTM